MPLPSALRALRHRNFRLFVAGQLISLVGTWMQWVAQSWLVYRLTGSAVLLGAVGFAGQIPVFVLASLGGAVADRHARHPIIVATQVVAMVLAFILATLTLFDHIQVWHIFVLAVVMGVVNAFDLPARQAFLMEMVGGEDLMNAIAINSSVFNGARLVGPAVAGLLVAAVGEGWCFFGNAVSYIAVIAGLLMMKVAPRPRVSDGKGAGSQILEGFRYVARTGPIRDQLILLGVVSLAGMPYVVLMPIFAADILHGGPQGLGILMGVNGGGALLGGMVLATRLDLKGLSRWIPWAAAAFGVSLVLFALSSVLWLSAALLVPVGFAMMVQVGASNTLIQSMTPDHMRGRVMAVYAMMFMGMGPFGSLLAGAMAHAMGAPATVAVGGVACLAGATVFALRLPHLRAEMRQLIEAQEAARAQTH